MVARSTSMRPGPNRRAAAAGVSAAAARPAVPTGGGPRSSAPSLAGKSPGSDYGGLAQTGAAASLRSPIMATRSRTSFQKRQKEIARMEKQRDKLARRAQRKLAPPEPPEGEGLDGIEGAGLEGIEGAEGAPQDPADPTDAPTAATG